MTTTTESVFTTPHLLPQVCPSLLRQLIVAVVSGYLSCLRQQIRSSITRCMQAVLVAQGARPSGTWHDNVDGVPPLVFFHFVRFLLGPGAPSAGIIEQLFVFRQHSRLTLSVKDLIQLVDPLSAPCETYPDWAWASGPLGRHGYLAPAKANRRNIITVGFNHTPLVKRSHSECQRCIPAASGVSGKYCLIALRLSTQHAPCACVAHTMQKKTCRCTVRLQQLHVFPSRVYLYLSHGKQAHIPSSRLRRAQRLAHHRDKMN